MFHCDPSETNFTQLLEASIPIEKEDTAVLALSTYIVPEAALTVIVDDVLFLMVISFPELVDAAAGIVKATLPVPV